MVLHAIAELFLEVPPSAWRSDASKVSAHRHRVSGRTLIAARCESSSFWPIWAAWTTLRPAGSLAIKPKLAVCFVAWRPLPLPRTPAQDHRRRGDRCRRLGPDRLEGDQRASGRVADTRRRVEAAILELGYASTSGPATRTAHGGDLQRAGERVGARDRQGRRAGRPGAPLAVVTTELHGRRTPGRGWIEGVLDRRPLGLIAVLSDLSETMRAQLRTRGIPLVVIDPTGEPVHDTPSIGATNWSGGLAATRHLLGLGTPADRPHHRARRTSCAAAPGWTAIGPPWTRPACRSTRTSIALRRLPRQLGRRSAEALLRLPVAPDGHLRRQRPDGARRLPGRS